MSLLRSSVCCLGSSSLSLSLLKRQQCNALPATHYAARRTFSHGPQSDPDDPNPLFVPLSGRQLEFNELSNFPDQPTTAPFGTIKHPALIYSGLEQRIVGCLGGAHHRHRLLWFTLKEGKPHVCQECGQVFKLVNDRNWHEVEKLLTPETRVYYTQLEALKNKLEETGQLQQHNHQHGAEHY